MHHVYIKGHFPMLSDSWCDMADVLGRVASISDVVSEWQSLVLISSQTLTVSNISGVQTVSRKIRRDTLGDRGARPAVRTLP